MATAPHSPDAPGAADGTVEVDELVSYAVELWFDDAALLVDLDRLVGALRSAAVAGGAAVLGEVTHVFPNDAVTAALVLSQSHLTIHTWPEYDLANVDLLAYGLLNGRAIIDALIDDLKPSRTNVSRLIRDVR